VRFSRLVLVALLCSWLIQGLAPLVVSLSQPSRSPLASQDRFPSDDPSLPIPLKRCEVEKEISDDEYKAHCLVALLAESHPLLDPVLSDRSHGFTTSRELLSTLHRLRI
jgi:hypothetical protein